MGSKNHCETIKSLQICYLFNINLSHQILDVDELKRRIISEWAALSHTVLLKSGVSNYVLAFVLAADIYFEHTLK